MRVKRVLQRLIVGISVTVSTVFAAPDFSVGSASTTEGDSTTGGTKNINIPVTLAKIPCDASTHTYTINYSTPAGAADTAVKGADYNDASGTLTFYVTVKASNQCTVKTSATGTTVATIGNNGSATQYFPVQIRSDIVSELDETFTAQIASPTGGSGVTTATALSTILDDDTAGNLFPTGHHRAFTKAVSYNMRGNMQMVGNSVMRDASTDACAASGVKNNSINTEFWDVDPLSGDTTYNNSTTANLALPAGTTASKIMWAGLYWQGYLFNNTDTAKEAAKKISFRTPAMGSYTELTSQTDKFNWVYLKENSTGKDRFYYQGVVDVTAQVKTGLSGVYGVANLVTDTGQYDGGQYGAWSLVVIYADSSESFKNMTVYDGYIGVSGVAADLGWNGVYNGTSLTLSGFLTPKSGDVNSYFSIFGGEGDVGSTGDFVSLSNSIGTVSLTNALNPVNDIFNSTNSLNGTNVTTRDPSCSNTIGIDLDTFNVGTSGQNIIKNNQTSTTVTLGSAGEAYFPGVFAFSTDLYVPDLCYDYAFKQYDRFFAHDDSLTAHLHGYLVDESPVTVRVMIRNQEEDSEATNIKLRVSDIDSTGELAFFTTQADLDLKKTVPNGSIYTAVPSSDITALTASSLKFNWVTDTYKLAYDQSVFAEFNLDPQTAGNIDVPLEMYLDFSYSFDATVFNMTDLRLDDAIPRCVDTLASAYNPTIGIFNAVDMTLNTTTIYEGSTSVKYNLPTHVVKRPVDLQIVSFNPVSLNTVKGTNGMVAVELIDMGGYYDAKAACADPNNVISPRLWLDLGDYDQNVTHTTLNASVFGNVFNPGITQDQFYGQARENAAYRISYNLDDDNGSVQIDEFNPGRYKLTHFTTYAGQKCAVDIDGNPNSSDTVPQWCGNNGTGGGSGMTAAELRVCMECIFGLKTVNVCSRDNFAIRPEAFNVRIQDSNNSILIPYTANVAAGYDYRFDINATDHKTSNAAPGYTAVFREGISLSDRNASFAWSPNGRDVSGCNDTSSPTLDFYFADGVIANQLRYHNNVGRHELRLRDYAWTKVDQVNHTAGSNWIGGSDCESGSSEVPLYSSDYEDSKPGCIISSSHHNNKTGIDYNDYALTFRPYKFDMASINFALGTAPNPISAGQRGFVYTSDMSRDDGMNMSVRASGSINAVGKNGTVTTNYVTSCYAEDMNLSLTTNNTITLAGTKYQARFMDFNTSGGLIYDSNASDVNTSTLTMRLSRIDDGNYTKDTAGSLSTLTRLNYERSFTQPSNPVTVEYQAMGIRCSTLANCTMYADGSAAYEALGNRAMDFNVTHAYGRIIPRDVRVFGNGDFTANAWYEVFNTPSLMGTQLSPGKNGPQWYINQLHNDDNDGNGDVTVVLPTTLGLPVNSNMPVPPNTGMETYAFDGIDPTYSGKAHINTDPWLWYGANALDYLDPVNPGNVDCRTHPCFNINVVPNIGRAGSATSTELREDKANKSTTSGNGVTYDYTPSTR